MQPFQYESQCSAAKGTSITHAAVIPRNLDAATTMRFATSCGRPAPLDAHGNTTWQQSGSHSTAICNQEFNKRKELRTQDAPLIVEHKGGTNSGRNDRSRNRHTHTHEVPFMSSPAAATVYGKTQGFVHRLSCY